ncbi:hypothetical protein OBBRIDRAFT_804158 [Obba rivulosa]|uniref:Uncharacterized protein n=1 Tax=Obba rivulosa TaxID=1052685 RepID=A0A8E2ASK2_9APHY|nr:hypothetical protein OBBRIDRAFT_804158 [Obba rivulosa]
MCFPSNRLEVPRHRAPHYAGISQSCLLQKLEQLDLFADILWFLQHTDHQQQAQAELDCGVWEGPYCSLLVDLTPLQTPARLPFDVARDKTAPVPLFCFIRKITPLLDGLEQDRQDTQDTKINILPKPHPVSCSRQNILTQTPKMSKITKTSLLAYIIRVDEGEHITCIDDISNSRLRTPGTSPGMRTTGVGMRTAGVRMRVVGPDENSRRGDENGRRVRRQHEDGGYKDGRDKTGDKDNRQGNKDSRQGNKNGRHRDKNSSGNKGAMNKARDEDDSDKARDEDNRCGDKNGGKRTPSTRTSAPAYGLWIFVSDTRNDVYGTSLHQHVPLACTKVEVYQYSILW